MRRGGEERGREREESAAASLSLVRPATYFVRTAAGHKGLRLRDRQKERERDRQRERELRVQ